MPEVLTRYADRWAIQGNVDPEWLHLPGTELDQRLRQYFADIRKLPDSLRRGWVCGLGHGILQKTPETNVRRFVSLHGRFGCIAPGLHAKYNRPARAHLLSGWAQWELRPPRPSG
jgi:uroporphyrinogen-III decarboxylase